MRIVNYYPHYCNLNFEFLSLFVIVAAVAGVMLQDGVGNVAVRDNLNGTVVIL